MNFTAQKILVNKYQSLIKVAISMESCKWNVTIKENTVSKFCFLRTVWSKIAVTVVY